MNNQILLIGRWTSDLQLNYVGEKEIPCLKGCIAVPDYSRKVRNDTYHTDFIDISVMGERAENLIDKVGDKGKQVLVVGKLRTSKYKNDDEQLITRYEVRAYSIKPLSTQKIKSYDEESEDESMYDDEPYENHSSSKKHSRNPHESHRTKHVSSNSSDSKVSRSSRKHKEKSLKINW